MYSFVVNSLVITFISNKDKRPNCNCINVNKNTGKFGDNAVFTYKYVLKGNKPGNYTVPAITINMNGKSYPTQSKEISIVKKSKDTGVSGDLMLQLKPNKTSVYVGEPIRCDLQWYSSFQAQGFQLKELPKFDGFVVKALEAKTKSFNS